MKKQMSVVSSSASTFQMDVSELPAILVEKEPKSTGVFTIVFSLFWGGIPTLILLVSLARGTFQASMAPLLVFTVLGAGIFVLGIWLATREKTTRIDRQTVSVDARWAFGHRAWSEPFSRYEGVLCRSEWHSGGKNSSSYALHIVELCHPDKKNRIRLYSSRSDEGLRKIWEGYCRALNLPALEGEGSNRVVRAVEDLDKSVRDLVREGKMTVEFDPAKQPPPQGLGIETQGDRLRLTLPKVRFPVGLLVIGLGLPGAFVYGGFFREGGIGLGLIGLAILLAAAAMFVWSRVSQPVVEIGPEQVRVFYRTPWGETAGQSLPVSEIESVRIGRETEGRGTPSVLLVSDRATVSVAHSQPDAVQEWLKNFLLAAVAR